ncbi:MAG TPA: lipid-A-disaccharide synthase, partial [Chthoniobacteraceae bacterium]
REIEEAQPDALILIDYPGFNLRLAKAVRGRLPRVKIIYYISPQVWAWNRGRIPKMARHLDLMLCIFPFEQPLYEASGLKTMFVGHPLIDALAPKVTGAARDPQLVGLFPGSREKEVRRIFPTMIETAQRLGSADPSLCFESAAASEPMAALMRELLRAAGKDERWCEVRVGTSQQLMQRAAVGMVASGTATLEAAYFGMPLVILYKVAWLTWAVGKRLVRVPFLGMPNILAEREIAREFLQEAAQPAAIAEELLRLLRDPAAQEKTRGELRSVISRLGEPGAGVRAAQAVCSLLAAPAR